MTKISIWLAPSVTIVFGILGVLALAVSVLQSTPTSKVSAKPSPQSSASTVAAERPSGEAVSGVALEAVDAPIAELADAAWVSRVSAATGIPSRALTAYAGAALAVAQSDPGCGIGWNTLAGVGFVESEHGTIAGGVIAAEGVPTRGIVGIPIGPDTDHGALDGDTSRDRAVGPMQFIPSSWALLAQDGNRDGRTDVNNIDDAALAAAVHLCDIGGDLTQPARWIAALSAYNDSTEYNHRVAAAADHYASAG